VKLIQKITKTMKMIANSRLRDAQTNMNISRGFFDASKNNVAVPIDDKQKKLIVPVFSDKGLCGALNSSMSRIVRTYIRERDSHNLSTKIVVVGDKGNAPLGRYFANKIEQSYGGSGKKGLSFLAASAIADRIFQVEWDNLSLYYNRFKTVMTYSNAKRDFSHPTHIYNQPSIYSDYEFEDEARADHTRDLLEFQVGTAVFSSAAENTAAELGSRMVAMDNATKSSTEMINKLALQANRMRQAAITTELSEIISGAIAVE